MGLMLGGNIIANNHEYGYKENVNQELLQAETAKNDAINAAKQALSSENNAKTSETICKASENNSKASETNAKTYMDNAQQSCDNAKAYAESIDPNSFVKKSGDTMTGALIIDTPYVPGFALKENTVDFSQQLTSAAQTAAIVNRDKNGHDGCFLEFMHDAYDANFINCVASNGYDPDRKFSSMGIWLKKDGTTGTFAPQCYFDNSICTTVSRGTNYVKLGNGLIFQWGWIINISANWSGTVTLPTPFTTYNYCVSVMQTSPGNGYIDRIGYLEPTSFRIFCDTFSSGANPGSFKVWMAFGY